MQAIQYHSNSSLCPTTDAEEAEVEWSCEDLDLLELTAKQRYHFHHKGLECKLGSQEIPEVTDKFALGVQNEEGQRLTELCQKNALGQANSFSTMEEMTLHMDITKWSVLKSDWLYSL